MRSTFWEDGRRFSMRYFRRARVEAVVNGDPIQREAPGTACPDISADPQALTRPLLRARFLRRELVDRGAELAGDDDLAVLHHRGAIGGREAVEHGGDRIARARTLRMQMKRGKYPHAALVKQAVQQPLARQIRIDQFDVF